MIDQDKMRALAQQLNQEQFSNDGEAYRWMREAADAIDALLAEVEAAAADKRDAERWRIVHETIPESELWDIGVIVAHENGVSTCNAHAFKCVELIDAALAQRQEES